MIDADESLRAAEQLSTSALAIYLQSKGWSIRHPPGKRATVFSKTLPGADEPIHVFLPEPGIDDERRRIADALRTIEVVEERPLESITDEIGHIRNQSFFANSPRPTANVQRRWVLRYPGTIEEYLTLLSRVFTYAGAILLVALFFFKVQSSTAAQGGIITLQGWIAYIKEEPFPVLLILTEISQYVLGTRSAEKELAIAPKLLAYGRIPTSWSNKTKPAFVLISAISFLFLYCLQVWFASNIIILSSIMTIVACMDFRTRRLIEHATKDYFADANYSLVPSDSDYELISRRRHVYVQYLERPHLLKEGTRIAGCGLAFTLSLCGYLSGNELLYIGAYTVLLGTSLGNEALSLEWRLKRDHRMKLIDSPETALLD